MTLKKALQALLILFVLLIAIGLWPFWMDTAQGATTPVELSYSQPGPYPVGIRTLVLGEEAPYALTVWYPSSAAASGEDYLYEYAIKLSLPSENSTVGLAAFAGAAQFDAAFEDADGPYPLIVLSPGFALGASTHGWLAEHIASYGFVVVAPEHREHLNNAFTELSQATVVRPQYIASLFTLLAELAEPGPEFAGFYDLDNAALVGHSYGGYTALVSGGARLYPAAFEQTCATARATEDPSAWLCDVLLPYVPDMAELAGLPRDFEGLWPDWRQPEVDAIVALAGDAFMMGAEGLQSIQVPVLAIGGTEDKDSPYLWSTSPTYEFASSEHKARVGLLGVGHMIFAGPCERVSLLVNVAAGEFCNDPGLERQLAHDVTSHFTTAFLLAELQQDAQAASAMGGDYRAIEQISYDASGY